MYAYVCNLFKFLFIIYGCAGSFVAVTTFSLVVMCRFLSVVASLAAEKGFSSWSTWAQLWCTGQLPHGMWNPLEAGVKPVSPALAGGFSTTGSPGKSCFTDSFLNVERNFLSKATLYVQKMPQYFLLDYF